MLTPSLAASSLKLLLIPVVLWANWEFLAPYVAKGLPNPFNTLLFISHRVPGSSDDDPRYAKGYGDLLFIAYYIIVWSFVRQTLMLNLCRPLARWFGIKKEAKLDRFGEQAYAVLYFGFNAIWGLVSQGIHCVNALGSLLTCLQRIMSQLPTWWYRTEYFWIGA